MGCRYSIRRVGLCQVRAMTKLRFKYPFQAYIFGPNAESLTFGSQFKHDGFQVDVRPIGKEGDKPLELKDVPNIPEEQRWFRSVVFLEFELETDAEDSVIGLYVRDRTAEEHKRALHALLLSIVNRVLRAYRNAGICPEIHEERFPAGGPDKHLAFWQIELLQADGNWGRISEGLALGWFGLLGPPADRMIPELKVNLQRTVNETIIDNPEPAPEQEFTINAMEFLRAMNFRMAVVEAVIALEIVLAQYLRLRLGGDKTISARAVADFLSPDLQLRDRLGVMLPLLLGPNGLKEVNLSGIRKVVGWRNRVAHKTGRLPTGVTDEEFHQGVIDILRLIWVLAARRDELRASPELRRIAEEVSGEVGRSVAIQLLGTRSIFVTTNLKFGEEVDQGLLERVVAAASTRLEKRDKHFQSASDLVVVIEKGFPSHPAAMWVRGKATVIKDQQEAQAAAVARSEQK